MKTYTHTKTCMLCKVDSFIVTKKTENTRNVLPLLTDKQSANIHTREYLSGIERNRLLIPSLCWMKGGRRTVLDPMWFHLWDILGKAKLEREKTGLWLLGVCRRGWLQRGSLCRESGGEQGGWNHMCHLWWWLHDSMHLSKLIQPFTKKNEFYWI